MLLLRSGTAVSVWAPAKVNLFLEVLGKRPDGYHEIATLMVAVSLYDTLLFEAEPSGAIRLECDHPELSTGPDNLICRAADLLRQRSGKKLGARIRLIKRIPLAAGLAGGSSDGAATLLGLNALWGLGWTREHLVPLGAELGSDIAFFFSLPAAWCTGRGEVVTPLQLGTPLYLVLACPKVGLSTAAVYRGVRVSDQPLKGEEIRQAVFRGEVEETGRRLHNRLQEPALKLCPEVGELLGLLAQHQPAGQMMSGSGTTVFALCRDGRSALDLAAKLRRQAAGQRLFRVFVVRTCV